MLVRAARCSQLFDNAGEIPSHFVWAQDARVHAFMRHSDPTNFGHLIVDDFLSAYTAGACSMKHTAAVRASLLTPHAARAFLPDAAVADLRLVILEWCTCCRSHFGLADAGARYCERYKTLGGWLQGLTPLDSLELSEWVTLLLSSLPISLLFLSLHRSYPHGTCFRKLLLGHNSALSVAYFHPSRAMIFREFREYFWQKVGLSGIINGPGFRAENHIGWRQRVSSLPSRAAGGIHLISCFQIILYKKTPGVMGSVWPEICSFAADVQLLLPSADVLCASPHMMDLDQQLLLVASGASSCSIDASFLNCALFSCPAATVHVLPHGGLSYALLFSRDNSAVRPSAFSKLHSLFISIAFSGCRRCCWWNEIKCLQPCCMRRLLKLKLTLRS
jgi:hypothetical protein